MARLVIHNINVRLTRQLVSVREDFFVDENGGRMCCGIDVRIVVRMLEHERILGVYQKIVHIGGLDDARTLSAPYILKVEVVLGEFNAGPSHVDTQICCGWSTQAFAAVKAPLYAW